MHLKAICTLGLKYVCVSSIIMIIKLYFLVPVPVMVLNTQSSPILVQSLLMVECRIWSHRLENHSYWFVTVEHINRVNKIVHAEAVLWLFKCTFMLNI